MNWQYKTIVLPSLATERENMLSEMGLNCWELVGFEQGLAYFKRPKADIPPEIHITPHRTHPSLPSHEQRPSKKK